LSEKQQEEVRGTEGGGKRRRWVKTKESFREERKRKN